MSAKLYVPRSKPEAKRNKERRTGEADRGKRGNRGCYTGGRTREGRRMRAEATWRKEDYTTLDLMKTYLKDEEDDMYWQEEQLALIDAIGVQNWLINKAI